LPQARAACLAVALACGAGLAIRLWNLRDQVLGGDELHAITTALAKPVGWILTNFAVADYSIPLTAALRLWLDAGGRVTELGLRVPGLVCGALLAPLVAWAAWRALDPATAARAAWLVALSPVLVLYSRIARSYAPMLLVATGAAIAGWWWIDTLKRRAALAWAALAALAIWLHLGAGPFVTAPLVFAIALRAATPPRRAPSGRELAFAGGALLASASLVLLPTLPSLLALVRGVRQSARPGLGAWATVAELQLGAPDAALAAVMGGLAALGLAALARREPRLAAYGATLVAAQVVGLLILSPSFYEYAFILNRYLLPCTPVLLAWIACGLGALAPGRPRAAALAAAALLALLALRGPLARDAFLRGSFAHHNDLVSFESERLRVDPARVPALHRKLAGEAPGAIVELPWHPWWNFSRVMAADQSVHGRRVIVSGALPELAHPEVAFRNFVRPEPAALAASGARWVVVHDDVEAEQARLAGVPDADDSLAVATPEMRARVFAGLRRVAAETAASLEAAWGAPDHVEPGLRAWRLP
jgi:hypothetical protein